MSAPDPSVIRIDGPWRHLDVHANGIRFHVVEALPADPDVATPVSARPLVMLLSRARASSQRYSARSRLKFGAGAD